MLPDDPADETAEETDEEPPFHVVNIQGMMPIRQVGPEALNTLLQRASSLEKVYAVLNEQRARIDGIRDTLSCTFDDTDLASLLSSHFGNTSDGVPSFFFAGRDIIYNAMYPALQFFSMYINTFEEKVLPLVRLLRKRQHQPIMQHEVQDGAFVVNTLGEATLQAHVAYRVGFPQSLMQFICLTDHTDEYLRARFVKKESQHPTEPVQFLPFPFSQRENLPEYTKLKFVEDNAVLTDALLQAATILPTRQRRTGQKKGEIAEHQMENAIELLIAFSDPSLLRYIQNPRLYFEHLSRATRAFVSVYDALQPVIEEYLRVPGVQLSIGDPEAASVYLAGDRRISRMEKRFSHVSLDNILQREEDWLPDSLLEKEQAAARQKVLSGLWNGMRAIAQETDDEKKMILARNVITTAVPLKERLDELLAPTNRRRLRHDLRDENEFYVAKQGHLGRVYFTRAPTPRITMEDVVGASFDRAKEYVLDLVTTATLGTLMRVTAPDGKVRQNLLLVGPWGCGKTEFAKACCGDKRVIGASVRCAALNTAYVHESSNNVGRVYDAAADLYRNAKEAKPVVLVLDEFDVWFGGGKETPYHAYDTAEVETMFLEVLDGMQEYEGTVTLAMTNNPAAIPGRVLRRFEYAAVVGELTDEERAGLLQRYIEKGLPVADETRNCYPHWAQQLKDAPGNTVRRVADAIHKDVMRSFIKERPYVARRLQHALSRKERTRRGVGERDATTVKEALAEYIIVTPSMIDAAFSLVLTEPQVRKEISEARHVYADAKRVIPSNGSTPFGLPERGTYFGR